MEVTIVERALVAIGLLAVISLIPFAGRVVGARGRRKAQTAAHGLDLDLTRPTVLYFWTPTCQQCRAVQAPTLARLAHETPAHIVAVDATADLALADRFGVMTVPTTIVLSPQGDVRAVNHGLASLAQLKSQLHT